MNTVIQNELNNDHCQEGKAALERPSVLSFLEIYLVGA